jgi:hypothetical protein
LTHLREAVRTGDREDLEKRLRLAAEDRETWLQERRRAEWDVQANQNKMPSVGDTFKRILIGERPKK